MNKLSRRDFLRLASLATGGAVLAACAPQPAATQAPAAPAAPAATQPPAAAVQPTQAPPPAGNVTIRWLDWTGQDDLVKQATDTFKAKYPNVTVTFEGIGDDWGVKQLSQMVAGNAPDILTGNDDQSYTWAEKGQLLDLNPLVQKDLTQAQIADFFDYQWKGLVHPDTGVRMGLPYYAWFYQWYYNKDALDKAGVKYPDDTWTIDDYSTDLEKLTVKDASGKVTAWGGVENVYDNFRFQCWLRSFGGHMVDPTDRTKCVIDSDEAMAALEWHRSRIWDKHTLASPDQVAPKPGAYLSLDPFANKKVSIMGQGNGDAANLLQTDPGFAWAATVPPIGPKGKRAGIGTIDNWGIWKGSKAPDMAWEFLKMLAVEDTFELAFAALWAAMPNRKSLLPKFKQAVLDKYPKTAKADQIDSQIEQVNGDFMAIGEQFKNQKGSKELIMPVLQKIFLVGDTPVTAVKDLAKQVTALNQEA